MKIVDIIVPVYNEEQILRSNITILLQYLRASALPFSWVITIVVNGSTDKSEQIALALSKEHKGEVRTIILQEGGKGNAIKQAALRSDADDILFMDVDLAVSLDHSMDVIGPVLNGTADLVLASRLLPKSQTERSFLRSLSSKGYNLLSRLLLRHQFSDLQCGFKAGTSAMFREILPQVQDTKWFFDTELVTLALRNGKKVREVPVSWQENRYDTRASKIHLVTDSMRFFRKLLLLRRRLASPKIPLLKRHCAAIVIALLVGALYAAPHAYFAHTPGYQGIYLSEASDEVFYMATINKSYASSSLVGDPYQYEYRLTRNPFQYYLVEFGLGKIGAALHLPIDMLAMFMKFIFPAVITLAVYALGLLISKSRSTALLASAAVLLGEELARPSLHDALATFSFHSSFTNFLLYSRPVNPQVSGIFFFLTLIVFYCLLNRPRSWKVIGAAGVSIGCMAYLYFYFWAFAGALIGVMALYALTTRRWQLLLATMLSGSLGFLLSVPFLRDVFSVLGSGGGALTQVVPTHMVIIEKMVLVPLGIVGLIFVSAWWLKHRGVERAGLSRFTEKYIFVLLLLITGVIVSNQQVLTGKLLQQHHFHFFTNIPLFVFAAALLTGEVLSLFSRRIRLLSMTLLLCLLFWHAVGVQISSYKAYAPQYVRNQQMAPVFAWLRENAPKDSVVLDDESGASYLPIYTQHFVYSSTYDSTYQVPQERVIHDYFVLLALRGVTKDAVRAYVYNEKNREEIGVLLFAGQYWRDTCGSYGCFPDSVLEQLIVQYKGFIKYPLAKNIAMFKSDYLLVDTARNGDWALSGLRLSPVYKNGTFILYAFK